VSLWQRVDRLEEKVNRKLDCLHYHAYLHRGRDSFVRMICRDCDQIMDVYASHKAAHLGLAEHLRGEARRQEGFAGQVSGGTDA